MSTTSHIVLVAFEVPGDTTQEAQATLLPQLQPVLASKGGPVECWWVADDERYDGSDNDSAVFVRPGAQAVASRLLRAHNLTDSCNLVARRPGTWEEPVGDPVWHDPTAWWVRIDRDHHLDALVGPYADQAQADRAMQDALLIDGLCQEDCLDAYTTQDQPTDLHDVHVIDPTNPDHTGEAHS